MPGVILQLVLLAAVSGDHAADANQQASQTDPTVSVDLLNGSRLTGAVDARTSESELWLRFTIGGISLSRSIHWENVRGATIGEQAFSVKRFKEVALEIRSAAPIGIAAADARFLHAADLPRPALVVVQAAQPLQVRALYIEARLANWDRDVEDDGLELRVEPMGEHGEAVSADGLLSVRLTGMRRRLGRSGQQFSEIGHWAQRIRAADFGPDGAIYRLPFQVVHPEFDLDYGTGGQVHAQLGIAGQGAFEATTAVRLRRPSYVRDQLELLEGRRFLPHERTGH